jgi:hypothetical protein
MGRAVIQVLFRHVLGVWMHKFCKNKSSSRLKIVGSRIVTGCRFCGEEPQILGVAVKKFIRLGDSAPGICEPLA